MMMMSFLSSQSATPTSLVGEPTSDFSMLYAATAVIGVVLITCVVLACTVVRGRRSRARLVVKQRHANLLKLSEQIGQISITVPEFWLAFGAIRQQVKTVADVEDFLQGKFDTNDLLQYVQDKRNRGLKIHPLVMNATQEYRDDVLAMINAFRNHSYTNCLTALIYHEMRIRVPYSVNVGENWLATKARLLAVGTAFVSDLMCVRGSAFSSIRKELLPSCLERAAVMWRVPTDTDMDIRGFETSDYMQYKLSDYDMRPQSTFERIVAMFGFDYKVDIDANLKRD
jgi:hypothetical protein